MLKKRLLIACALSLMSLLAPFPALAATLSLSPATGTFGKSCSFSAQVLIDTVAAETDGADVILLFDPAQITASSIVNGSIYSDFPGNTIDNSTGKVSIFALAPSAKGFTGKGTVATVNFTTTATASAALASIKIDFDQSNPTKTTDSNVLQRSDLKDVLSQVTNGAYTLNPNSTNCSTAATQTVVPQKGGGVTTLPESGIWEPAIAVGGLGILLVSLGITGLKKFR